MLVGDDPQVDVRLSALVRDGSGSFEAEAPGSVRHHGRTAGAHVVAAPVRLPEMDDGAGDRAAVDRREHDAGQYVAGADLRAPRRRAAAERPCPVVDGRLTAGRRGRSRDAGAGGDESGQDEDTG